MKKLTTDARASPSARGPEHSNNQTKEISMRTEKLNELKAAHREKVARIRADRDITLEARERRVREETQKFDAVRRAEEDSISHALDAEIERAYRAAHGPAGKLDATGELRMARLREEIKDELDTKRLDPIRGYEQAVRAGDTERASVIAKIGPRYLDGFRRMRLGELVEANLPEKEREARQKLARLEREREDLQVGLGLSRLSRSA